MSTLAEIRTQFPQYADMPDAQLAEGMYKKFYSDMPRAEFDQKIGVTPQPLSASDVASQAVSNVGPSAVKFAQDIVQPIVHPIDTISSLAGTVAGLGQKAYRGVMGGEPGQYEKYPDAIGLALKERYGGTEEIKKTLATDPVGALGDVAMVLTGGGLAAARAPGILGKLGNISAKAGAAIDPLTPVLNVGGKVASQVIGGLGTHTGPTSLQTAFHAGQKGDKVFQESLRGHVPMEDVVTLAKSAVSDIRQERNAAYKAGMETTKQDMAVLKFDDVSKAAQEVAEVGRFKNVPIDPRTHAVKSEIAEIVDGWRKLDPVEYHTPIGFDALKRAIGEIKDAAPFNSPERLVANKIYNAIRETITKQVPEYAKTMKNYERASTQINEIERGLSLGKKASADPALRKLQSVMRDNVSTNYGNRTRMAEELTSRNPEIMPALAGQAMSSWIPRGLAGKAGAMAGLGAGVFANPAVMTALPFMSPRLMGEASYYTGKFMPSHKTRMASLLAGREAQSAPQDDALIKALMRGR